MYLINCKIFDGEKFIEKSIIEIQDDKITNLYKNLPNNINKNEIIDIENNIISPGFMDLQLNGCGGALFNDDISTNSLKTMHKTNLKHGCTAYLPTLITSPDEKIIKALNLMKELKNKDDYGVLGLHIEGPNISLQKKGVHNPDYIRVLDDNIIEEIINCGHDNVKILTMAPETVKKEHVQKLAEAGINLSIGHSFATYEECVEHEEEFTHATHLYNAMRPLHSRAPGVIGYIFHKQNLYSGIIPDGYHFNYENLDIAKKQLGEYLYIVTDAVSPAGTNMKSFIFEGQEVFHEDGRCITKNGTLGGSALTMDVALKNTVKYTSITLDETLKMMTSIPARAVQLQNKFGFIKPNYQADLTIIDKITLDVLKTMKNGKEVYVKKC